MSRARLIAIDPERLKNAIYDKELTLSEASRKIGRGEKYLGQCCTRGSVSHGVELLLDTVLDIPLGVYIATKPEEKVEEVVAEKGFDYEELQNAIYHALIGAIRKLQAEGSWL